jgi:uncharacterized protein
LNIVYSTESLLSLLSEFKKNYGEKYGIIEMGIFGSYARGDACDDSDIDVWIKTVTPDPFNIVHLKEFLEIMTNRHVDIVRLRDTMNPYLKEIINSEGLHV